MGVTTQPKQRPKRYVLYTALIAAAMMLAIYLYLGVWPFGGGTVLTGDLNALYINFFAHFKRALAGQAGLWYGFDKGLGGNLAGLLATYCSSPLNLFYALAPVAWFPVVAAALLAAKVVLAAVFCRVYLAARFPTLGWGGVALALCYGFCAYSFAYAQNPMWHDALLLLPLVCLGIEHIAAGRGFGLYTGALALAILANFYTAYMVCIFSVIYFVYTMVTRPAEAKAAGKKGPLLHFAAGSALAGGMGAALLLPALANISGSKGLGFSLSGALQPLFPLRRLAERFVLGAYAEGEVAGHLPFVYSGALMLLLVGCYFISKRIRRRDRLVSGLILLVFLLSFWVKGLDALWHGLKAPVWFPARYSFIFCFFCVVLAATALAQGAASRRTLLASAGIGGFLLLLMATFPLAVSRSRILLTLGLGLVYAAALGLADRAPPKRRRLLGLAAALVAAAELAVNAGYISNQFEKYPLADYQSFVTARSEVLQAAEAQDPAPHRTAENAFRSLNDAMLLGYSGLGHFASTQDSAAQNVLYGLGYRVYGGGGPYLYGNTAFADSVLGLSILMDSGEAGRAAPAHWQPSGLWQPSGVSSGEVDLLANPTAAPLLFTAQTGAAFAPDEAAVSGSPFDFQAALYTALTGDDAGLWGAAPQVGVGCPVTPAEEPPARADFVITATQAGYHYAYVALDGEAELTVNGTPQPDPYGGPLNSGVISLGYLEAGQQATLEFASGGAALTADDLRCLPAETMEAFAAWAKAGGGGFTVEDGLVQGIITAQAGRGLLYTSIPWAAGWAAQVNGRAVQPKQFAGGLLAVPLQPGENTVTLRYTAPGTGPAGWVLSALCLALYLAALALFAAKRRRSGQTKQKGE